MKGLSLKLKIQNQKSKREVDMRIIANLIASAGLGAGLMYLLDPYGGKRRRSLIRDKAVHGVHTTGDAAGKVSRDMKNRAKGVASLFKRAAVKEEVSDSVLVDRVRSELGGVVGHPGSIHVEASDQRVRLSGVVLKRELKKLIKRVKSVRGVREIEHDLEVHDEPGNVPGLQGEPAVPPAGERFELMQENWSPSARLVTGLAGGALAVYGLTYRGIAGKTAIAAGLPLLTRAATNMPLRRIVGISGRRAVDIQKTTFMEAGKKAHDASAKAQHKIR
ncbi:MAG: BON domain-containing protein [Desulfobacteraceae bacterium]|nr:MAG: BON domain-containing protein [Desulfobacteraceae bacterium]